MPGMREPRPAAGRRVLARLDEAHEDRPVRQVLRGRTSPRAVWRRDRFGERCSPAGLIGGGQAFAHERDRVANRRPTTTTGFRLPGRAAGQGPPPADRRPRPAATHWSGSRASVGTAAIRSVSWPRPPVGLSSVPHELPGCPLHLASESIWTAIQEVAESPPTALALCRHRSKGCGLRCFRSWLAWARRGLQPVGTRSTALGGRFFAGPGAGPFPLFLRGRREHGQLIPRVVIGWRGRSCLELILDGKRPFRDRAGGHDSLDEFDHAGRIDVRVRGLRIGLTAAIVSTWNGAASDSWTVSGGLGSIIGITAAGTFGPGGTTSGAVSARSSVTGSSPGSTCTTGSFPGWTCATGSSPGWTRATGSSLGWTRATGSSLGWTCATGSSLGWICATGASLGRGVGPALPWVACEGQSFPERNRVEPRTVGGSRAVGPGRLAQGRRAFSSASAARQRVSSDPSR